MDIQSLIATMETFKEIAHTKDSGFYIPIYNKEEQLCAAEELCKLANKEYLPALKTFFSKSVLKLNNIYD